MFTWNQSPPKSWLHDLALLAPIRERASHLTLFWESGSPAFPVQRWVVYEALPAEYVPDMLLDAFLDNPPCRCPYHRKLQLREVEECHRCHRAMSVGRQRTWDYWHQTRHLAQPFWIIQGGHGGHPRHYTKAEQMFARLMKLHDDPPVPGALPYAPFDRRVRSKLIVRDRALGMYADMKQANLETKRQDVKDFRRALVAYLDESVDAAIDEIPRQHRWNDVPVRGGSRKKEVDYEQATDHYIKSGQELNIPL